MSTKHEFPKGFLWGTATAAHQVEGNNIKSASGSFPVGITL